MITQREVAKEANVSTATVSRYINKSGYISPKVKRRIQRAITKLGYQPNLIARSLKIRSTRTIGLIFPAIENTFFISVVKSAEEIARKHNYNIILCNTENESDKEQADMEVLKGKLVDGYIVIPTVSNTSHLYDILAGEKVVFVDRSSGRDDEVLIKLDNMLGVKLAVEHLLQLGHRNIAAINIPTNTTPGYERYEGYRTTLAAQNIPLDEHFIQFADFSLESGYEKMKALLASAEKPTAVVPMSILTTLGALKAINEFGYAIPDDISLVGFDEFEYADLVHPPLTTVAQPAYEFGIKAVETLLKLMKGKRLRQKTIILQPRLIIRKSCKRLQ
ncbi:LacI family DNA-binding transcriptional regulator [candidate division KSB3 bacterium]|uniref:LacI family DNA-binding transcriptional regulator n=1 Tax=candidate division KSB3 bacterium TaxID=2044937 RepID=A0A9D5Q6D7_9BACT|nr:LacI family DNA-binding transcriptional regulator [candidate division KSB3 bacterium]MBD3325152.1 LacI family DNA-binding transcriptional regulator [candidate division KSB3 bacterium]